MKKAITLLLVLLLLLGLCACTYGNTAEEGSFKIMYGSYFPFPLRWNPDGACVYQYTWDGDEGNTDIVIPDAYASRTIRKLGGAFGRGLPSPFDIDVTSWMGLSGGIAVPYDSSDWDEIVYHDFDLYLSKEIDGITGHPCAIVFTVDGVKTAYCPRVTVHCDEDNETFYSRDGRLYFRKTDELVEEFVYSS